MAEACSKVDSSEQNMDSLPTGGTVPIPDGTSEGEVPLLEPHMRNSAMTIPTLSAKRNSETPSAHDVQIARLRDTEDKNNIESNSWHCDGIIYIPRDQQDRSPDTQHDDTLANGQTLPKNPPGANNQPLKSRSGNHPKNKGKCCCTKLPHTIIKHKFRTCEILIIFILTIVCVYLLINVHTKQRVVTVKHHVTGFPAPRYTPDSLNVTETVSSATLYIDWKQLLKVENTNYCTNITWRENDSKLIHLTNKGRTIQIMKNGTYNLYLTLNLDVDGAGSLNAKSPVYTSWICIQDSSPSLNICQRQKLHPHTAITVSMKTAVTMLKGDYLWVSVKGVDQIYKDDSGSRLIIQHFKP